MCDTHAPMLYQCIKHQKSDLCEENHALFDYKVQVLIETNDTALEILKKQLKM